MCVHCQHVADTEVVKQVYPVSVESTFTLILCLSTILKYLSFIPLHYFTKPTGNLQTTNSNEKLRTLTRLHPPRVVLS